MADTSVIVYSSLFPNKSNPVAGIFVRERTFRVAKHLPLAVVAPQPWSPLDWAIRLFRKSFRPTGARFEIVDGVEVYRPRFLCLPALAKRFDGWLMAVCTQRTVRRLQRKTGATVIDAHFVYPDGYAATRIARRLGLASTITIGGSKDTKLIGTPCEPRLRDALSQASRLISVSDSLRDQVALAFGQHADRVRVIGNGVDANKFFPIDRLEARSRLGIDSDAKVLIGVGNLVELKGFHRIIPLLPALRRRFPNLLYLIVGGGSSQGDMTPELKRLAIKHAVADSVRLCGRQTPDNLKWYYSAADTFALATSYEGWANVFLEAMACGLPVITTRVGGNEQVVANRTVGRLINYWDGDLFLAALIEALECDWDRDAIVDYARANGWDRRIDELIANFHELSSALERANPLSH